MTLTVWQKLHDDLTPGAQPDQASFAVPFAGKTLLLPIRTLANGRGVLYRNFDFRVFNRFTKCQSEYQNFYHRVSLM